MLTFARFPSPRRASVEHAGERSAKSVSVELEMSPSVNSQLQQEKDEEEKQQQQQVSEALKSNYPNIPEIS